MVDAALLRPGRLEQHLYVPPPDHSDREQVLQMHLNDLPLAQDVQITSLASLTERFSCAALASLCREATQSALARYVTIRRQASLKIGSGEPTEMEDLSEEMKAMKLEVGPNSMSEEDALGSLSEHFEINSLDFNIASQIVCASGVPSADAYARMIAGYESFGL